MTEFPLWCFYAFAIITVVAASAVVILRSPVHAATTVMIANA